MEQKQTVLLWGIGTRPFDEAVDLMNEWLARYKTA